MLTTSVAAVAKEMMEPSCSRKEVEGAVEYMSNWLHDESLGDSLYWRTAIRD